MDHWGTTKERRRFRRYRTKNPAFVIFKTIPTKLAEIQEISIDGLSCVFIDEDQWDEVPKEINILYSDDEDSYLEEIPTKLVTDHFTDTDHEAFWQRRNGVQFGALTPEQRSKLVTMIRKNTVEL